MYSKTYAGTLRGIDASIIAVETDVSKGLPSFNIVGLPDKSISEAKERISVALRASHYEIPPSKILVNLSPAQIRKEGVQFDLAIAVSLLVNCGFLNIDPKFLEDFCFLGELSLRGEIKGIGGILAFGLEAQKHGFKYLVISKKNSKEASLITLVQKTKTKIFVLDNLEEVINLVQILKATKDNSHNLSNQSIDELEKYQLKNLTEKDLKIYHKENIDLQDVIGQRHAKRGLEIAAAGSHHILMIGPPGCGKSMLAKRFKTLIPKLSMDKALETTKIHSISNQLKEDLVLIPPFRSPHHSASVVSLIGGGPNAKPGEISLAHNGVLFLDELTEFNRHSIEQLRQVLEEKTITINRIKNTLEYPANFTLIAACNPCPCGFLGDLEKSCVCTPFQISRYITKLSGPFLDRIDIHIELSRLSTEEISKLNKKSSVINESSQMVLDRIQSAKDFAAKFNPAINFEDKAEKFLEAAVLNLKLSARSFDKITKVSRTIANLALSKNIQENHVAEALQFRTVDWQKYGL